MAYTQLFNLLCEKTDDVYGGRQGADEPGSRISLRTDLPEGGIMMMRKKDIGP